MNLLDELVKQVSNCIIGEKDVTKCKEWLVGRTESTQEEWDWVQSIIHKDNDGIVTYLK